jgi:nicotinamidase/pyrazinamidase
MVRYGPRTALLVVDVQNDFADPAGSLYVNGGERLVPRINAEVAAARSAGSDVVYTTDWHPAHTPHFAEMGGVWPVHCVRHSWGAEFHPDLVVDGDVIRKGTGGEDGYSAFTLRDPQSGAQRSTGLAALLRAREVEAVLVVGIAADYCVHDSALDARSSGFAVAVLRAATAAVNLQRGDEERAFGAMVAAGVEVR